MGRGRGRSRSPRGRRPQTEWISRAISGFGRYPERRPSGLDVDKSGTFMLDDLMRVWGHCQNLTQEDVMHALQVHMYQFDGQTGKGALRFAVNTDLEENIIIRVMPKRERRSDKNEDDDRGDAMEHRGDALSTQAKLERPLDELLGDSKRGFRPPRRSQEESAAWEREVRQKLAPLLQASNIDGAGESGETSVKFPASLNSWQRFLVHRIADEMHLAHFSTGVGDTRYITVQTKHEPSSADAESSMQVSTVQCSNTEARRKRVLGRFDQMGLTTKTMNKRLLPRMRGTAAEQIDDEQRHRLRNGNQSEGEKLQRWIVWVLKAGHAQLGVAVDDGWVNLAELAAIMHQQKPRFGEFDAEKLALFLKETDTGCRFEVTGGRLRLVPQEPMKLAGEAVQESKVREEWPDSSRRWRSVSPLLDSSDEEDRVATIVCDSAMDIDMESATNGVDRSALSPPRGGGPGGSSPPSGGGPTPSPGGPAAPPPGSGPPTATPGGGPPPLPPGDHWTKFNDDGLEWWYYEGPLGKWCCADELDAPTPYEEDE